MNSQKPRGGTDDLEEAVDSTGQMRAVILLAIALVVPVVLIVLLHLVIGDGYAARRAAEGVFLVGPVLGGVVGLALTVFFPPFLVTGSVDPVFALVGVYPVMALVFFLYRRWETRAPGRSSDPSPLPDTRGSDGARRAVVCTMRSGLT